MATLPTCVKAHRLGLGETQYDEMGELAPVSWTCVCGAWLMLETLNDADMYVATSQQVKDEFLANHTTCVAPTYMVDDYEREAPVRHDGTDPYCECERCLADSWGGF